MNRTLAFLLICGLVGNSYQQLSIEQAMAMPFPRARATPSITADDLINNCMEVEAVNRSPREGAGVHVGFTMEHLFGIEDVKETTVITATVELAWTAQCPNYSTPLTSDRVMIPRPHSHIYKPPISFRSAADDISMQSGLYYDRMEAIYHHNSTINGPDLIFFWKRRGIFKSTCSLELDKFPFDEQKCGVEFNLMEPSFLIRIESYNMKNLISNEIETDIWSYKGSTSSAVIRNVTLNGRDYVSEIIFSLSFHRSPYYYLRNLVVPNVILNILALATFLIPPENSDRLCFCVYLVLAISVGQGQVLSTIPFTPQSVLLNNYVQMLALHCVFCNIDAIIMYWWVTSFEKKAKRRGCCGLSAAATIDFLFFFVALGIFVIINAYYAKEAL